LLGESILNSNSLNSTQIEYYLKEALLLQGQLQALTEEKKTIVERVQKAKKWLQKQPDYTKFLQHLQDILHQKNVGAFSELLSYFVRDVLKKDKDIILEQYAYRNMPALRIEADNAGNRESIIDGNGGSIANIVSTGLRLIALSRMTNRKFIVLDEPDCWLKPDHIPLFAKIIGEISNRLNIQTVIISHHHWKYFKDYGRVIELKYDGPHLRTEIIHDTVVSPNAPDDVIKRIILRRFMSHYDTHFELHPNLTCIIGENDIGKSVLSTALKAVSYADSQDSYIMHNENEAQVVIELSEERKILWQRFRVTNSENHQKVKFGLYKPDQQPNPKEEYSAHDVPDFIARELNISTVEDIDVHIGNQKQPIFLLGPDVKPQEKAKILSLGKDSLHIQKMMEYIKQKNKENKQIEKEGEARFSIVEKQLYVLENIGDIVSTFEDLKTEIYCLQQQQQQITDLEKTIDELTLSHAAASIPKIDNLPLEDVILNDINEIEYFIEQISLHEKISHINKIDYRPEDILLHDIPNLDLIISQLSTGEKMKSIDKIEIDFPEIELHNTKDLSNTIVMLTKLEQASSLTAIDINLEIPQLHNIEELNQIINQLNASSELSKMTPINVSELTQLPTLNNIEEITQIINQLEQEQKVYNDLLVKKQNVDNWKNIIDKEIEDFMEKTGHVCPTCHQEINKQHILGIEHATI
jgi:hypothetical protein